MSQPVNKRTVWIVGTILFVAMALTLPVFYYLFVVGGIMTYATLATMSLPILFHSFDRLFFGAAIVNGTHLLVYGVIFFVLSKALAKYLCRYSAMGRLLRLVVMLIILFSISSLQIFGFFSHGAYKPQNAYYMGLKVWSEARASIARTD